ncbi:MAG: CBS domain-containing protein [Candidatus Omnitrophica bacterium]|nr:CBS domain-containing protein [Candidatus Omnitrophota bacterium]
MFASTFFGDKKVTECPINPPVTTPPETSIRDAVDCMREAKRGYVLVCSEDKLCGIFTERHLLDKVVGRGLSPEAPISQVMRTEIITIGKNALLTEAIQLMDQHHMRRLPIVDEGGSVLGLITVLDILNYLSAHFPSVIGNLPPRLHQKTRTSEGG